MKYRRVAYRNAFTLPELMMTITLGAIVMLGAGVLLVDGQRGWSAAYNSVHGDVSSDGYAAIVAFNTTVRKSSLKRETIADSELTVYYYNDSQSSDLDRFAKFYAEDGILMVDDGDLDGSGQPRDDPDTMILAHNVTSVNFSSAAASIQMALTIDDGSETLTMVTSAVRHNE